MRITFVCLVVLSATACGSSFRNGEMFTLRLPDQEPMFCIAERGSREDYGEIENEIEIRCQREILSPYASSSD